MDNANALVKQGGEDFIQMAWIKDYMTPKSVIALIVGSYAVCGVLCGIGICQGKSVNFNTPFCGASIA